MIFKRKPKQPKLKLNTKWTYLKLDIIGKLVFSLFKIETYTVKYRHVNKPDFSNQYIFALWHAHQCSLYGLSEIVDKVNILISPSNDGEIITAACKGLGFKIIRGSKGRKGSVQAVFQMLDVLKTGDRVAVTVDGPKGPNHVVQKGIIELAKLSGVPIIPMVWYSNKKNFLFFNSWDKFTFPLGFCNVVNSYGDPIYVDKDITEEEFEQKRLELQNKLEELYADLIENYDYHYKTAIKG